MNCRGLIIKINPDTTMTDIMTTIIADVTAEDTTIFSCIMFLYTTYSTVTMLRYMDAFINGPIDPIHKVRKHKAHYIGVAVIICVLEYFYIGNIISNIYGKYTWAATILIKSHKLTTANKFGACLLIVLLTLVNCQVISTVWTIICLAKIAGTCISGYATAKDLFAKRKI